MAIVRAKRGIALVTFVDGVPVNVVQDMAFDSSDPVVREHPEWFQADAKAEMAQQRVTSVAIEDMSAVPGQLRNR